MTPLGANLSRVPGLLSLAVTAVMLAFVIGACDSDETPRPASLTVEEAITAFDAIVSHVETPDLSMDVGTSSLGQFQRVLLEGHEFPPTPGLVDARRALESDEVLQFCTAVSTILRNTFVNRLMSSRAGDAVEVLPSETAEHDPSGLFLEQRDADIVLMGSGIIVPRNQVGLDGDVLTKLWKDDALALMDLVYGLGQECIDAAKQASP